MTMFAMRRKTGDRCANCRALQARLPISRPKALHTQHCSYLRLYYSFVHYSCISRCLIHLPGLLTWHAAWPSLTRRLQTNFLCNTYAQPTIALITPALSPSHAFRHETARF
jgi:hypothetical protein